jgi:hypothetical protein
LSGNVWGAQAASLSFSAACRKALEDLPTGNSSTASTRAVAKLTTTAGWAPREFRSIAPQEIRLPPIRGPDLAEKNEKKVLTVSGPPD